MSYQWPPDWMLYRYLDYYRDFLDRLVWAIDPIGDAIVTSWFRDEVSNRAAGGHPFSQHRLAFAMDFVTERKSELATRCRRAGLIPVVEGSHIHVQAFPAGTVPQSLFVL
jgi:hypothetical protein